MADVTDVNLQGCPDRKNIQVQLAEANYQLCAAQEVLDAAHMAPITPDDSLTVAKEKVVSITTRLADHTRDCPACAEIRKTA
jgi:hypothetical protein